MVAVSAIEFLVYDWMGYPMPFVDHVEHPSALYGVCIEVLRRTKLVYSNDRG